MDEAVQMDVAEWGCSRMSRRHEWTGFTWRCIFISDLLAFLTYIYNPKHAAREEQCRARNRDRFQSRYSCCGRRYIEETRKRKKKSLRLVSAVNRENRREGKNKQLRYTSLLLLCAESNIRSCRQALGWCLNRSISCFAEICNICLSCSVDCNPLPSTNCHRKGQSFSLSLGMSAFHLISPSGCSEKNKILKSNRKQLFYEGLMPAILSRAEGAG